MGVVRPSPLLLEAAGVLESIRDDVVVIGALAVQVALDGQAVALAPTRDIDAGVARGLPVNNMVTELGAHRVLIAFDPEPQRGRFWAASPAALVALEEAAFGRTRHSGEKVDRDFSDAAMLLDRLGEEIASEIATASSMRGRVMRAARRLSTEEAAIAAAARELLLSGHEETHLAAEATVRRAARRFLRRIEG